MIKELIKKNRRAIAESLNDIRQIQYLSSPIYIGAKQFLGAADEFIKGRVLDIGCGHMPYRREILARADHYDTLDVERRVDGVTYVGSVVNMPMVKDRLYDVVVCWTVLEHVPQPFHAISEIRRVLKEDGIVILCVPHMSRLHELPHDYFRFTEFGVRALMEPLGFNILRLEASGSILSLVAHQWSTLLVGLTWHIPLINKLVFWLNKIFIVLPVSWLETKFMRKTLMPLNYFCVAQKIG